MVLSTLRLVRGIVGVIGALQLCELVLALERLNNLEAVTTRMVVVLAFRVVVGILGLTLFCRLRKTINSLYAKRHGVPHPALQKVWNL